VPGGRCRWMLSTCQPFFNCKEIAVKLCRSDLGHWGSPWSYHLCHTSGFSGQKMGLESFSNSLLAIDQAGPYTLDALLCLPVKGETLE
jgi:hypothetical protein